MNELMFLILLALSTCSSTSLSHPSSNGINPHPHAHCALSETLSQLVNRIFLPIAILINTIANLTNQHQLHPAIESTAAMPLCSTSSTIIIMPTRSKEAENQKKEEEVMAAATLQQEKEAAAHQRKEDTARTTAVKPPHQQPAVRQVTDTPSIPPQPEPPPASVVSPPSATNLNSLLSGQVGQEGLGTDANTSTITIDSDAAKENFVSPTKKKTKKLKEKLHPTK